MKYFLPSRAFMPGGGGTKIDATSSFDAFMYSVLLAIFSKSICPMSFRPPLCVRGSCQHRR